MCHKAREALSKLHSLALFLSEIMGPTFVLTMTHCSFCRRNCQIVCAWICLPNFFAIKQCHFHADQLISPSSSSILSKYCFRLSPKAVSTCAGLPVQRPWSRRRSDVLLCILLSKCPLFSGLSWSCLAAIVEQSVRMRSYSSDKAFSGKLHSEGKKTCSIQNNITLKQ